MSRATILDDLKNNSVVFYKYNVQEGDTPETVAHKYYGDPYKYWIVMYSNQLMDPLWDWPMNYQTFIDYLTAKYEAEFQLAYDAQTTSANNAYEYVQSTVYRYEKITTTTDLYSTEVTVKKNSIDFDEYYALAETDALYPTPNYTSDPPVLPFVRVSITKNIVYIYDYENDINESRREIKLLNQAFVGSMEEQFKTLMSA
jgi:hypothetical protein